MKLIRFRRITRCSRAVLTNSTPSSHNPLLKFRLSKPTCIPCVRNVRILAIWYGMRNTKPVWQRKMPKRQKTYVLLFGHSLNLSHLLTSPQEIPQKVSAVVDWQIPILMGFRSLSKSRIQSSATFVSTFQSFRLGVSTGSIRSPTVSSSSPQQHRLSTRFLRVVPCGVVPFER